MKHRINRLAVKLSALNVNCTIFIAFRFSFVYSANMFYAAYLAVNFRLDMS